MSVKCIIHISSDFVKERYKFGVTTFIKEHKEKVTPTIVGVSGKARHFLIFSGKYGGVKKKIFL